MEPLTQREQELVALAAALASNCVPCIDHHIPEARRAGLTDDEIRAALELADKVRQVPARNVLRAALAATGGGTDAVAPEAMQCTDLHRTAARCC